MKWLKSNAAERAQRWSRTIKSLSNPNLRKAAELARNAFHDLKTMADLLEDAQEVDADHEVVDQIVDQLGDIAEITHTLHSVLIDDRSHELETKAAAE